MKHLRALSVEAQFFLSGQLHPTPALNTMTEAVGIRGPLALDRLTQALRHLSVRHVALRTRFQAVGGTIVRIVDENVEDEPLDIREAAGTDEALADAAEAARRAVSPESRAWKATLLRHGPDDHTFLFSAHRCIWDERSMETFAVEISALYHPDPSRSGSACSSADEVPTDEPGETLIVEGARHLAAGLADVPALHWFPLKTSRPRTPSVAASSVEIVFDDATMRGLSEVVESLRLDPFIIQTTAAAYVLAHYCGQRKLAIGMPFPLRPVKLENALLGSHTAILPLGFSADASTFASLVAAFAASYSATRAFAATPFHALVKECAARIDSSANPLFQIAFAQDGHLALQLDGCDCRSRPVPVPPQHVHLFLQFTPTTLRVAYASEIIQDEIVASLGRSISAFLAAAVREPQRELSGLPLIAESDRATLVIDVNRTAQPSFLNQDLYAIATRHCTPGNHKDALVCNGAALSYADLLGAVESVAARLCEAGVAEQDLVGICLPRSPDMVAAMLAVLRCGNAYVPLDPAFPRERLSYMVEHSRLAHVITTKTLRPLFDGQDRLIELDDGRQAAGSAPEPTGVLGTAKAYVIYTSGSTGRPKGVAVPRSAVANFLLSMLERPGICHEDILCSVTTLSFDIAVLELLAPLCAGATVVIATEEEARDPRLLAALLQSHRINMLQATPVTWQMLCAAGWSGDTALTALCGGEALAPTLAQALTSRVRALWNMYGPTETTVWSTCHNIGDATAPISVGTPIHNTFIYVLDEHRRPVPRGVEGQLFIGGEGVALGYLHDEELTRTRFHPDPFVGHGRMYDTGDRARFDQQGLLYIVGRSDSQVKLRGFRIELGEIETQLAAFAGIEQVVCIIRRDDPENPELVAYYVLNSSVPEPNVTDLRQHCGTTLPSYMVPSRFMRLDALPLTPNGKVDRKALPQLNGEPPAVEPQLRPSMPRSRVERTLLDIWCRVLSINTASVNDNFFELGGTSLAAFSVAQEITRGLGVDVPVLKIFEHPTVAALAQFLRGSQADGECVRAAHQRAQTRRRAAPSETAFDVAIVGAAGRFPGARDLDQLWKNLCEGRETVTVFSRDELDPLVPASDRNDPNYIPARGVLEDTDLFDAAFFGINPNEAELMDPQLRVFLEVAWEAFENSGYVGEHIDGLVGVWAGMGNNFYYHHNVLTRPDKLAVLGEITAEIANEKDHIAPRVSHKLNLTGPSLSVHTACSTTLVVVENAYQALVTHQVDVALAGGVDIRTPQKSGQRYEEGGVFSNDGHCRPFDAAANGTMFGEGAGAIVLKRLDDALRDNDTVYAIIKGGAVNHDGGHKVTYLAPSVEGQARVIASALALGDVNPDTVTYVEAHGTGTPIGDPIEVEALTRVFRTFTQRRNFCVLGSIKGNFGHATTAAGIAGILKVVLALRHRKIPPTLHFKTPNPHIDFARSPFFVNTRLIDWEPRGIPRRASVSSFGFCGTNAYVVLEEAPPAKPSTPPARPAQLVLLSARSPKALDQAAERLSDMLEGMSPADLADAAYTTQVGRKRFEYRRCAVVSSAQDARGVLTQASSPLSLSVKSDAQNPPVAFMFPGQGSQYINMGLRLYQGEEVFREAVNRCATALAPHLGCDLRDFLFPDPADAETATQSLNNTFYTQPAIFTISYSLALLFINWGIEPTAFIGHSIGEFVAATLSGVMELDEALRLVATRGRLMQGLPPGAMLSVRLPLEKVVGRLPEGADLAAVNGPQLCVVAGPTDTLQRLSDQLSGEGIMCRMLHTSHAFHSSMMDPVVEPFLRIAESVRLSSPRIPFVSTVTGDWIKPSEVTDPSYWARHLRSPVQFSKAVQVLLQDSQQVLVECGPRRTCVALAHQHRPKNPSRVISSMPDSAEPDDEYASALMGLGALWLNGCTVNWHAFHNHELRRRVALPGYAFQRKRFWLEPGNIASFSLDTAQKPQPARSAASSELTINDQESSSSNDDVMNALVGLLEEAMGAKFESFDENAPFIALGLDSLLVTQLARMVRVRLGFQVTFRQLAERYLTPKLLADAIRAAGSTAVSATAAVSQDSDARTPSPSTSNAPSEPHLAATVPGQAALTGRTPGVRLGRDEDGRTAWFLPDPSRPDKYLKVANCADSSTSQSGIDHDPFASPAIFEFSSTRAQREMWLSAQSGPNAACAYNESFWVELSGPVDDQALLRALQTLTDMHEALRGHFSQDGERFVIEPAVTVSIGQHDFTSLAPPDRDAALNRLQSLDAATPHDLDKGPLFRAAIVRMDMYEWVVMLSAHGAACDGWSLDVLLADFGRLYSTFVGSTPLPSPRRHSFSDYVKYCQTTEFEARAESSRTFWRGAFAEPPPPLALPYDGHRPATRSYGARHSLHAVSEDLPEVVKVFSRAQGLNFVSVLLASFATVLHRISGSNDLVIGIPVAGHPDVGMEDCVGRLVNLTPIRSRFRPDLTFLELCRATQTAILDARENASISFGEIVSEIGIPLVPGRVPFLAAIFTHAQRYAPGRLVFADCSVQYHLNTRSSETFELNINAIESHNTLQFKAHANSDLCGQAWLDWRLRELECLLRNGCTSPDTTIDALEYVPTQEISIVMGGLDHAADDRSSVVRFDEVLRAQTERTPERIAIRFGKQQLSYSELEARSDQLSNVLRRRGIGRGILVGLCLEPSVDMVVAVFAVMKAGGGYVPLDPAFPGGRLAFMLADSGLALVVSRSEFAQRHGCPSERTINLDDEIEEGRARVASDEREASGEDVAYVLYTSDSSGNPKGVYVHHRALTNSLVGVQRELGFVPEDSFLAVTATSFDNALLDVMLPLSIGAQAVLVSRDEALDGMALRQLLESSQVTVVLACPDDWRLLVESGWQGQQTMKAICDGDGLCQNAAESLLTRVGELWVLYGAAEATVWSTCWCVAEPDQGTFIGRPIANTWIRILDPQRNVCPIGIRGEIYIGGDGVALGYLNRPKLSGERFIADAFGSTPGARLYKTGAVGRWRADGVLECLGRTDLHVKVRGLSMELGEIETVLMDEARVRQAAVTLQTDTLGDPRIVAYVVCQPGQTLTGSELRRCITNRLPAYMLPNVFIELENMALTADASVDRSALPRPYAEAAIASETHVEPRTETELAIAALWCELLKVERVSVRANFFALGGYSLLSAQMVERLLKRTGHRLSLRSVIFETLEQLAANCGRACPADPAKLSEVRRNGRKQLFSPRDQQVTQSELLCYFRIGVIGGGQEFRGDPSVETVAPKSGVELPSVVVVFFHAAGVDSEDVGTSIEDGQQVGSEGA